jgi:UDP-N-acetylmuramyl pentapeptide phosphotransferase/UDP-N-acetylglucosamine-1-phosphate transferase
LNSEHYFILGLTFTFSALVNYPLYKLACRIQWLKQPNSRSVHLQAVPLIGGFSIALTFLGGILSGFPPAGWSYILVAYTAIMLVGLLDDIFTLSPYRKILIEMLAGLIVIWGFDLRLESLQGFLEIGELGIVTSTLLTLLFLLIVINAINLIDGIDGFAGGFGMMASAIFAALFFHFGDRYWMLAALVLTGALAGFLIYNLSRHRKIFMGDAGSLSLGFMIAIFSLRLLQEPLSPVLQESGEVVLITAGLLMLPVFDIGRLFLTRLLQGISPFQPDRNHIHHLLIRFYSHRRSAFILVLGALLMVLLLYFFCKKLPVTYIMLGYLFLFGLYCLLVERAFAISRE